MISIEIKENMNEKHGDAIGYSCRVEIRGKGDLLAAQVKCGGECEGCKYDC